MAGCRVCNEQTESQWEERTMAKFRTRLKKVMEETVPEDSVICSGCQFDLEQIEMYYCLLNAFKKRYWQAAEERSKNPEGYVAPTNRNILVETFRASTLDSKDILESRKSETIIPLGVHSKIGEVPTSRKSTVESLDMVGKGLELGCWSKGSLGCKEGSEEHQKGVSLKVISALNLYSVKNAKDKNGLSTICSKDKRGYFFYEGSTITDQVLKGPERKTWLHVPLKRRVGRPRKYPVGHWLANTTPKKNQDRDWHPLSNGMSPRKRGRPRKIPVEDVTSSSMQSAKDVTGPKKRGRPRKNPLGKPDTNNPGRPVVNHVADHIFPKKRGRPKKIQVGNLIAAKRIAGRPMMNHVTSLIHPSIGGSRKPGRPRKIAVANLIAAKRIAARPMINCVAGLIQPSTLPGPGKRGRPRKYLMGTFTAGSGIASRPTMNHVEEAQPATTSPKKRGRPKKNTTLGSVPAPSSLANLENGTVAEVDEGLRPVPTKQEGTQRNDKLSTEGQVSQCTLTREQSTEAEGNQYLMTPKKRGRPRKYPKTEEPLIAASLLSPELNCSHDTDQVERSPLSGHFYVTGGSPPNQVKRGRPIASKLGPRKCTHCGIKLANDADYISHNLTHKDTKPFKCASCGKGFHTRGIRRHHELTHMGGKREKFICTICGKALLTKPYLKHHMARHTAKQLYRCSICDKVYTSESLYKTHLSLHTDEKPYKCQKCGKGLLNAYLLRIHMMKHTGERPFKCQCGLAFRDKGVLKVHMKSLKHAMRLANKRKSKS